VKWRRVFLSLLAPRAAVVVAMAISSAALLAIGKNPLTAFKLMGQYGAQSNSMVSIVNRAVPLYLSALAVAIGFKMNLFNIGVEGQYTLAALVAAAVGAAVHLPAPIHITLILFTGMAVGALWAGVAGVLKVTRGVSEVISTIMLNLIATSGLSAYLLNHYFKRPSSPSDLTTRTHDIPASGLFPPLNKLLGLKNPPEDLTGFLIVAIIVGVIFYVLVWRTRFGYNLRASGLNPDAARASGVDPGAMVIKTMLLSGAIAGLVGMMYLLSFFHSYSLDFPTGLGFAGIAVALVGRNHPGGIALAALLFGFLDRSAQILDLNNIPKEIFLIIEGIIILAVVIAYEVVRRLIEAQEVRSAAEKAKALTPEPPEPERVAS
jgi:general nucleoside transport system permease protein